MYINPNIYNINKSKIGDILNDPSDNWCNKSDRPFINALIKLEYLERIESNKIKKLKDIPIKLTIKEALKLSKKKSLPKRQPYSTWGKLVDLINSQNIGEMIIDTNKVESYRGYMTKNNVRKYLGLLEKLEFINYIKTGNKYYFFKIKKIKNIPDKLTVSLAQKMLYDNIYKRSVKIDKIKEKLNNI